MSKRKGSRKRDLFVMDFETDPFEFEKDLKVFAIGVYSEKDGFHAFDTVGEAMAYLEGRFAVVYMHNGGRFDFRYLLRYCDPYQRIKIINNRLAGFRRGKTIFRDSFLILPLPLSAYKKDEIDYDLMQAENRVIPSNAKKILKYLQGDCEYLYDLVKSFRDSYGSSLTLASSGMAFWKKLSNIQIPECPPIFYETFKQYYFGGRVECFEKGLIDGPIVYYDINGAYPFVMRSRHPWGTSSETLTGKLPDKDLDLSFIKLRCRSTGAFPFRAEKGGLSFPSDGAIREFCVTGHEYLAALETKRLYDVEIISSTRFLREISFEEYQNYFTVERSKHAKGTPPNIFAKLFQNSLYGKFGQDPGKYRSFGLVPSADIENGVFIPPDEKWEGFTLQSVCRDAPDLALVSKGLQDFEKRYYNVATAASITGAVRAILWRAICKAKRPLYCDTDSLMCFGLPAGYEGDKPGQWKVEAHGKQIGIGAKKGYALHDGRPWIGYAQRDGQWEGAKKGDPSPGWKVAAKGFGRLLTGPQILSVASGKVAEIKVFKPSPSWSVGQGARYISRTFRKV